MKAISLIILSIIVCACFSNTKDLPDNIEIIPVEVSKVSKDASSFLEKIEIVPLETNDSSLLFRCNKIIYDSNMDMYYIYIPVIKSYIRFQGLESILRIQRK